VIIDPESGAFLSELTASRSKGVTDIDRTNDISGNLVIIDNLLFAVAYNGEMVCFDRASGAKIWNRNVSSYHGLASDLVNIILSHENDSIYSFDKNTGKTVWKNSDLLHRKLSAPLIYDNFILTLDYLGILHVLDLDEGVRQAIFQFDKSFEGLVDFGDSLAIRDTINTSKLYKHKDFVYIILNHSKIIKISINE
jgi:outer membrane protein assembly factor BamB